MSTTSVDMAPKLNGFIPFTLGTEFGEFFGVGQGQGHEIDCFEVAQSAHKRVALAEGLLAVGAAGV